MNNDFIFLTLTDDREQGIIEGMAMIRMSSIIMATQLHQGDMVNAAVFLNTPNTLPVIIVRESVKEINNMLKTTAPADPPKRSED